MLYWTQDKCLEEFRNLIETYPDKSITRDFFRKNSPCPESAYERFWGNFTQFRIAAGYDYSDHQSRVLSNVAKHASKDALREYNIEKSSYEDKYLRPCKKRYQTIVTISDTHDIAFDPFTRRVYLDTLKRIQPETIVFGGDHFDLPSFSKFYNDPRQYNLTERINNVHQLLHEIREILPDAEFNWISSNHEYRLMKHLCHSSPSILVLLNDIHGYTISSLLGLDKFQINYISRDDLTTFTESDIKKEVGKNYLVKHHCLFHHYPEGKRMGLPGVNGHHHVYKCENMFNLTYGSYFWSQIPGGHNRRATYTEGQKWSLGFMISHHDTQNNRTVFEPIDTTQDFAIVGGKWYTRTEDEIVKI